MHTSFDEDMHHSSVGVHPDYRDSSACHSLALLPHYFLRQHSAAVVDIEQIAEIGHTAHIVSGTELLY